MNDAHFSEVSLLGKLVGYVIQYFACGLLVPAALLCFGALIFCQIALFGSDITWLGHILALVPPSWMPSATTSANVHVSGDELGKYVLRAYWLLSLLFMAIEMIWRMLRRALFARPTPSAHPAESVFGHVMRQARHRIAIALGIVSLIFAGAFFAIPHARMAVGSSHATMVVVFVVLYVFAAGFAMLYALVSGLADLLIDGLPTARAQAMQRSASL